MKNLDNFEEVPRTRWVEMLEENAVRARQKANFLKYLVSDEYADFSFLFVTQSYNFIREILQEYCYMLKKLNYKISFHSNEIFLEDGQRTIQIIRWYKGTELENYGVSETRGSIKIPPFEMYISPPTKEKNKVKSKDTITFMESEDFKDRFRAEYFQLKNRRNGLDNMLYKMENEELDFTPKSSYELLRTQWVIMGTYLSLLEERARVEDISLKMENNILFF